jgi:hypothetical protein
MQKYTVLALSVSGRKNKIFRTGDVVYTNDFSDGTAEGYVLSGHLQRWAKPLPTINIKPTSPMLIYTCRFGEYDEVRPIQADCDCVIFTDKAIEVPGWRCVVLDIDGDRRRASRWLKINSHLLPYKATVYIDARVEFLHAVEMSATWPNDVVYAYKHFERDCIYDEAEAVLRYNMDVPSVVNAQMARYRAAGYLAHHGLYENGVLMRRNTPALKEFEELWWREYSNGSVRDQLSMMYCAWATGMSVAPIHDTKNLRTDERVKLHPRRKKKA